MFVFDFDEEDATTHCVGPKNNEARNAKTYTRFIVDGIILTGAMITLLYILLRRQSYKPLVMTQLGMIILAYSFLSIHNCWHVLHMKTCDKDVPG